MSHEKIVNVTFRFYSYRPLIHLLMPHSIETHEQNIMKTNFYARLKLNIRADVCVC